MLEIPLGEELTANCLIKIRTNLQELIQTVMAEYGLNRVQLPLWLQQSLLNGLSWYVMSLGLSGQQKCAHYSYHLKSLSWVFSLNF